jgi:hypothetical protein
MKVRNISVSSALQTARKAVQRAALGPAQVLQALHDSIVTVT